MTHDTYMALDTSIVGEKAVSSHAVTRLSVFNDVSVISALLRVLLPTMIGPSWRPMIFAPAAPARGGGGFRPTSQPPNQPAGHLASHPVNYHCFVHACLPRRPCSQDLKMMSPIHGVCGKISFPSNKAKSGRHTPTWATFPSPILLHMTFKPTFRQRPLILQSLVPAKPTKSGTQRKRRGVLDLKQKSLRTTLMACNRHMKKRPR